MFCKAAGLNPHDSMLTVSKSFPEPETSFVDGNTATLDAEDIEDIDGKRRILSNMKNQIELPPILFSTIMRIRCMINKIVKINYSSHTYTNYSPDISLVMAYRMF